MTLLIDTNIFLEVVLDQERADEAEELLANPGAHELFVSDFTLHSIGMLLFRRKEHEAFWQFWTDVVLSGAAQVVSVTGDSMAAVVDAAQRFDLDFDDAYQYSAATAHELTIVSFDTDFDRTDRGRKTPVEILDT